MRRRSPAAGLISGLAVVALLLGVAACGGPDATAGRRVVRLPSLRLLDVGSGRPVNLAHYQPRGKPLLVWAWAPYCPYCRREAPAVEQFARLHGRDLQIIGVGTQNTPAEAQAFRTQTGIRSFPLLYEADGFRSWKPFGFTAQPAASLLGADGRLLATWSGPFDEAAVLKLIAA